MEYIIGLVIIVAIIGVWLVMSYKGFRTLRNSVEECYATMDIFLKKRLDLIPKLLKAAQKQEGVGEDILEEIRKVRATIKEAIDTGDRMENENILSEVLNELFSIRENYPEIKVNSNFLDIQNQIKRVEEDIASSGRFYNAIAKLMNTKVVSFPSNWVAKLFHFNTVPMF
ncbi:MAG: LemA family protein [Anaerovoracaceae bacterium]